MLFAVSEATVPKISVILRKSYGAGYFVMNGLAYEADYIVAWPTAEIAVMGPDGAVEHHPPQDARSDRRRGGARGAAARAGRGDPRATSTRTSRPGTRQLDDVIDPADTRAAIARGLRDQRATSASTAPAQARRAPRLTDTTRLDSAMHEIRAEITANVWQVVVEEGQMVAEGDEICILESMKMEIPVITEVPGVVRELHVEPEQTVQEGDLIALIDES